MYGFNPTLGSNYWNSGSSSSGSFGSSGTDWKTDWNTIGDYSGLSGKPYDSGSSWSGQDKWKDALAKGISWFSGTGKDKYRSQAERQQGGVNSMPGSSGSGSGFQQVAPDAFAYIPPPLQPFTVAGQPSSGGSSLGSGIGAAAGFAAGMLIPGAQPFTAGLMDAGSRIGGSIG